MQNNVYALGAVVEMLEKEIEGLLILGEIYHYGNEGTSPDLILAESYYREAAEMGDWEGMRLLAAVLEEQGLHAEALLWLARAASEGDEKATALLRGRDK